MTMELIAYDEVKNPIHSYDTSYCFMLETWLDLLKKTIAFVNTKNDFTFTKTRLEKWINSNYVTQEQFAKDGNLAHATESPIVFKNIPPIAGSDLEMLQIDGMYHLFTNSRWSTQHCLKIVQWLDIINQPSSFQELFKKAMNSNGFVELNK